MKKTALLSIILVFAAQLLIAQGYNIKVKVKNADGAKIQLAYYFADKQYIQETKAADKKGVAVFSGEKALPHGIYMIIVDDKSFFDLLISNDQEFSLSTSLPDLIDNMKVSDSEENEAFFRFQKGLKKFDEQIKVLAPKDSTEILSETDSLKIEDIKNERNAFWKGFVKENPDRFLSKLLYATSIGEINPFPFKHKEYFFNRIDFSEAGFIRSPMLREILYREYAIKYEASPLRIINHVDSILRIAERANKEIMDYAANFYLQTYAQTYTMGMNYVAVFIAENYFLNKRVEVPDKLFEFVDKKTAVMRSGMEGSIAPNLKLEHVEGDSISLHDIKAKYTMLFFWKTGCGHCDEAGKALKDFYDVYGKKRKTEVIAVYTKASRHDWENVIDTEKWEWTNCWDTQNSSNYVNIFWVFSTPLLIVMDENKKILLNLVGKDQIIDFSYDLTDNKGKIEKLLGLEE